MTRLLTTPEHVMADLGTISMVTGRYDEDCAVSSTPSQKAYNDGQQLLQVRSAGVEPSIPESSTMWNDDAAEHGSFGCLRINQVGKSSQLDADVTWIWYTWQTRASQATHSYSHGIPDDVSSTRGPTDYDGISAYTMVPTRFGKLRLAHGDFLAKAPKTGVFGVSGTPAPPGRTSMVPII